MLRLLVACRRRVLPASDGDAVRLTVVHVGASQHVVVVTDVGTGFPVGGGRSNFNMQPPPPAEQIARDGVGQQPCKPVCSPWGSSSTFLPNVCDLGSCVYFD